MLATKTKTKSAPVGDPPDGDLGTDSRVREARERALALEELAAPLRRRLVEMDEQLTNTPGGDILADEIERTTQAVERVEKYENAETQERLLPGMRERLARATALANLRVERARLGAELTAHDATLAEAKAKRDETEEAVNRERSYAYFRDHIQPKREAMIAAMEATVVTMRDWFDAMAVANRAFHTALHDVNLEKLRVELIETRRHLVDPLARRSAGEMAFSERPPATPSDNYYATVVG